MELARAGRHCAVLALMGLQLVFAAAAPYATASSADVHATSLGSSPTGPQRPRKQSVCALETESAAAMGDCCADGSGHRRQQSANCNALPSMCPSAVCAESFGRFWSLCGQQMRTEWGAANPQLDSFVAFNADCAARFGDTLAAQIIPPDDPNLQLIGRFMRLSDSAGAVTMDPPAFAEQAGCNDGYRAISTLAQCERAKAALEPELRGVEGDGALYNFGRSWPDGCFTSAGSVYFRVAGSVATNAPLYDWTSDHQALCELDTPPPPQYAVMAGCSNGYGVIEELSHCTEAKAMLEPSMQGVVEGGYGAEWADGCFFNAGVVYFGTYGTSHTQYSSWNSQHQALCILEDEDRPAAQFEVMAGCSDGYETIFNLPLCEAAKTALEPTLNGVQSDGFGTEWSNGCFFNGDTVYFHTTGVDHGSYSRWNSQHQALCALSSPEPAPEPEPPPEYEVMAGCHDGYVPIMDLDECATAKAVLEPGFSGPQNGGFGNDWAAGCFFNGNRVYFGTYGNQAAHTDAQSYRANGGWSNSHKALCAWSGEPLQGLSAGCADDVQDVCGVCGGDGSSCVTYELSDGSLAFDMPGCELRLRLELSVRSDVSILLGQQNAGTPQNAFVVWINGERQGTEYGVAQGASFTTKNAPDEAVYAYRLLRSGSSNSETPPETAGVFQAGTHDIRVFKTTEANWNGQAPGRNFVTFSGFLVQPIEEGAAAVTVAGAALHARKIEFLGDSITAGYCNECQASSGKRRSVALRCVSHGLVNLGSFWYSSVV